MWVLYVSAVIRQTCYLNIFMPFCFSISIGCLFSSSTAFHFMYFRQDRQEKDIWIDLWNFLLHSLNIYSIHEWIPEWQCYFEIACVDENTVNRSHTFRGSNVTYLIPLRVECEDWARVTFLFEASNPSADLV